MNNTLLNLKYNPMLKYNSTPVRAASGMSHGCISNLYTEAIELVCGGSPIAVSLWSVKPSTVENGSNSSTEPVWISWVYYTSVQSWVKFKEIYCLSQFTLHRDLPSPGHSQWESHHWWAYSLGVGEVGWMVRPWAGISRELPRESEKRYKVRRWFRKIMAVERSILHSVYDFFC